MDGGHSLFDFIGIFIGFVCIILLLSIAVTTMVQTIQAGLRLRGRNLQRGIRAVIETVYGTEGLDTKTLALKALHSKNICILGRIDEEPEKKFKRRLGPPVSYIDPEDLPKALESAGLDDAEQYDRAAEIIEAFNRMWKQLENRFLWIIRIVTVFCAIVVAGYFQVSTPALLEKLSKDAAFRDRAADVAEGIEKPVVFPTHEELSDKALATLEGEFPGLEEKIEEASGIGSSKAAIVAELDSILADMGEGKDKIIERYNELLDGLYAEGKETALKEAGDAPGMLATLDITGWREEWGFYFKSGSVKWGNVIGVLMTAALLTLGAPFWFEQLKRAMNLRDILSKGIKKEGNGEDNEEKDDQTGGGRKPKLRTRKRYRRWPVRGML
jgi:hypothetical protein